MIAALRPYFMVLRNSMMAGLSYRVYFMFMALGNLVYVIVAYFLWQAIYASQPTMQGLSFSQAYLQIAVSMAIYTVLLNWVEWFMSYQVQGGDVVRYLTKPLDYQLSTLFDSAGGSVLNLISIAIPTVILAWVLVAAPLPGLVSVLFCILSVLIAFFISFCIDFLVGLISFATTSIWGFSAMKEIIVLFCSGALIPLQFFPPGIKTLLDWLPFQAIYNSPVTLLLNPSLGASEVAIILAKQAGWLVVLLVITRLAYKASIRKMVVNGG